MNSHEGKMIDRLVAGFDPPPHRLNACHEADAELLDLTEILPCRESFVLAATTDTISEEIATGLYHDPFQIGWMAAAVNLSDLAAVGAKPVGLLISETIPASYDPASLTRLQAGIREACRECGTHLIGGDTNSGGDRLSMTGTALGVVDKTKLLTRAGARAGDLLYTSGTAGRGNAYAFATLHGAPGRQTSDDFRPVPRIREGMILPGIASSCIDSSDGFLGALDVLGELNHAGFRFRAGWERLLHPPSAVFFRSAGIPPWLLLAGCHGDFELLITVPPARRIEFLTSSAEIGWEPIEIGEVIGGTGVRLPLDGETRRIDTRLLRNIGFGLHGGVERYLHDLLEYHDHLMKGQ